MKRLIIHSGLLLLIMGSFLVNCSKDITSGGQIITDYTTFKHSINGWELYSWPSGNDFNYSLLEGTGSIRSLSEVTSNYYIVHSKDTLTLLLNRLPKKEVIRWYGQTWLSNNWGTEYGNLMLPPTSVIQEIQAYCEGKELSLTVHQ